VAVRKMWIFNVKEIPILKARFLNINEKLGFFRYSIKAFLNKLALNTQDGEI
jgi:hypothetical protein